MSEDGESENFKKMKRAIILKDIVSIYKYLKSGFDVNERGKYGRTYLMIACEDSSYDIIQLLIDYGAKVNHEDNNGENALFYVLNVNFEYNSNKIIEKIVILLKYGIKITSSCKHNNIFLRMSGFWCTEPLKLLIEHPDISTDIKIPLLEDAFSFIKKSKFQECWNGESGPDFISILEKSIDKLKNGDAIKLSPKKQKFINQIKNLGYERKNDVAMYFRKIDVKIDELQPKIDELQSKINELQSQIDDLQLEKTKFFKHRYRPVIYK